MYLVFTVYTTYILISSYALDVLTV